MTVRHMYDGLAHAPLQTIHAANVTILRLNEGWEMCSVHKSTPHPCCIIFHSWHFNLEMGF